MLHQRLIVDGWRLLKRFLKRSHSPGQIFDRLQITKKTIALGFMLIGTSQAASLLDVCPQRVRQLLKEGRVVGAEKIDDFWRIPLFNGMPKVIEGTRGPKSTWSIDLVDN